MNKIILLLCATMLLSCKPKLENSESAKGNLEITGSVENANQVIGQLNMMGFLVEPNFAGKLDNQGTFNLDLPNAFDELSQEAFDKYNALDDAAYKLTMTKGSDMFFNTEGLETSGLENRLALAGTYYGFQIFKDGNRNGAIYPTSSVAFMTSILEQKPDRVLKGHYYYFVYSKNPIIIKGKQQLDFIASEEDSTILTQTNTYNISIKKGWNAIKYEVLEVVTNDKESSIPVKINHQSVSLSDEDIKWYFINGKKAI